jgi:peptidoglycan/xylan/chitin deacetylase (PgdA/CDA1 family)
MRITATAHNATPTIGPVRRDLPEDVLVLCYHAVSHRRGSRWTVAAEHFERQIAVLQRRGYVGATFNEALTTPPARRVVAITFDDASRSVLRVAFPILQAAGLQATVFVPTAYAPHARRADWAGIEPEAGLGHDDDLVCMSWEEIAVLADAGWEIGSHTRSHPMLSRLDDAALTDELVGSRVDCEESVGRRCRSLAYPYSDVDARVVAAARAAGYAFGATVAHRPEWPLPLRWPRVAISSSDADRAFAVRTSVATRRAQATALGGRAADAARRVKRHGRLLRSARWPSPRRPG